MRPTHFLASCLTLSALLVAPAAAGEISASYTKSYGGSIASGYLSGGASAFSTSETYNSNGVPQHAYDVGADAHLVAGVKVFWVNAEAFRFETAGELSDDTGSTSGTQGDVHGLVRIGPWTVYNVQSDFDLTASKSFGPYSLFGGGLKAVWWLGPVPVTVKGDAGCGAQVSFQVNLNPLEHLARATPSARAWQYGSAKAYVSALGFSAGAWATLKLADTTLAYTLQADLEDGLSGWFSYQVAPISIYLKLYTKVNLWYWKETWYKFIYSWSASSSSGQKNLL